MTWFRRTNKVQVLLRGGIGNQLFQYFAGLELAIRQQKEVEFDDHLVINRKLENSSLHLLNTSANYVSANNSYLLARIHRYTDALQFRSMKLNRILSSITRRFVLKEVGFSEEIYHCKPNQKLIGYFQSWRHYDFVKTKIKIDLLEPFKTKTDNFLESECIDLASAIALHVRRGDYVLLENTYGLLGMDYYQAALSSLGYDREKDKIWIFTDATLEEISELLILDEAQVRIINNTDKYNDVEQLALMARFNKIVIANSSFSWWAARLASEKTLVVSPYNWYKSMPKPVNLIPNEWIQIENKWL